MELRRLKALQYISVAPIMERFCFVWVYNFVPADYWFILAHSFFYECNIPTNYTRSAIYNMHHEARWLQKNRRWYMELDIYADIVFIINFSVDFLILIAAGRLADRNAHLWRLILGAAIMALLYCLSIFVSYFHIFYHLLFSVIMLIIGICVAYCPIKPVIFVKLFLFSYICAFLIGGTGMAIYYAANFYDVLGNIDGQALRLSLPILIAAAVMFYILFRVIKDYLERRTLKRQICMPVRIFMDEKSVEINALVDTGNSLRDPLSRAPVIVAEFESIKSFLPDSVKLMFYGEKGDINPLGLLESQSGGFDKKLRMIPYESLGKKNGMLIGFRPDKVEITRESDIVSRGDVVIGIYNFALSRDGDYQGLLNPELIA
jgi:stage II sporulation protein GA (sporulation sigma-E factor processing peptidase)